MTSKTRNHGGRRGDAARTRATAAPGSEQASSRLAALHDRLRSLACGQPMVAVGAGWDDADAAAPQLMRTLARHSPLLWIERPATPAGGRLAGDGGLRGVVRELRGLGADGGAATEEGHARVVRPPAVALPAGPVTERLNRALFERALGHRGRAVALHWAFAPESAAYLDRLPRRGLIYRCTDASQGEAVASRRAAKRRHADLCASADVVVASSEEALEACRAFTDRAFLVPDGVDWEPFASAVLEPAAAPPELADVEGPVAGCLGPLRDFLDQEALVDAARAHPEATFVVLGRARVLTSRLQGVPNIRLLGHQDTARLPSFAARFDLGLLPFLPHRAADRAAGVALGRLLAAGLPVVALGVTPDVPECARDRVGLARDRTEFVERMGMELARGSSDRRTAVLDMLEESWLARAVEMMGLWRSARVSPAPGESGSTSETPAGTAGSARA